VHFFKSIAIARVSASIDSDKADLPVSITSRNGNMKNEIDTVLLE
jgi:hypothetical protein